MIKFIRNALVVTTAFALGACGILNPAEASTTNPVLALPPLGLTIQIQNATDIFNTVGQIINYNYVIAYTGTTALTGPVTVADAQGAVVCPGLDTVGNRNNSLDQNETITCTSTYAITQADINLGSLTKKATASAGGVNSNEGTVVATIVQTKTLTLTKTASQPTYNQLGAIITYTYVIKNSGNVAIGPTQFTVADDHISAPIPCGSNTVTLLPTETVSCTAQYPISQADLSAALVTNNATASGGGVGPSQPAKVTINNSNVVQNPSPGNYTPGTTIQHKVVAGEWLIQIARCYGANFTSVRNANTHITDPDVISVDTIVTVPNIGSAGKIYGIPCVGTHTVQSGDTWASIAQRYNADVVILQAANPGSSLALGSVLKIPLNSASGIISTPAATVTPGPSPTPTVTVTSTQSSGTGEPIRISFTPGTTTATVSGNINPLGTIRYVINGGQGQLMNATLTANPATEVAWAVYNPSGVAIRPLDATTTWNGILPVTGDYRIDIISLIGNASKSYSLTVSITTPIATEIP